MCFWGLRSSRKKYPGGQVVPVGLDWYTFSLDWNNYKSFFNCYEFWMFCWIILNFYYWNGTKIILKISLEIIFFRWMKGLAKSRSPPVAQLWEGISWSCFPIESPRVTPYFQISIRKWLFIFKSISLFVSHFTVKIIDCFTTIIA